MHAYLLCFFFVNIKIFINMTCYTCRSVVRYFVANYSYYVCGLRRFDFGVSAWLPSYFGATAVVPLARPTIFVFWGGGIRR